MSPANFGIDRLTTRHTPRSLVVSMKVPAPGDPAAPGVVIPATVLDISVLGACLEGRSFGHILPGETVGLSIASAAGRAEIRYAIPAEEFGRSIYGVVFLPGGDLQESVNEIIATLRGHDGPKRSLWV